MKGCPQEAQNKKICDSRANTTFSTNGAEKNDIAHDESEGRVCPPNRE